MAKASPTRLSPGRWTPGARTLPFLTALCLVLFSAAGVSSTGDTPPKAVSRTSASDFQTMVDMARDLASRPYLAPPRVPDPLMDITYDQWRDIRFRPDKSLWRGERLPFEVQFFHPGLYFDRTVALQIVENGMVRPLSPGTGSFDYGHNDFGPRLPPDLGMAGFRLHTPMNKPDYYDECLVFLGASYLRAVAKGQGYGMSARGLAVDTASPQGEEFPWFRLFRLFKPKPGDKAIIVHALLDSRRLCGAFSYTARPGKETVLDVQSVIFLREPVDKLGIAPLTSMFFFGENTSPRPFDDYRPEVHDSDGLQLALGNGEWLWRPLCNPRTLQVSSFATQDLRGFGLMQRDRRFESYEDLESHYDNRPSVWIEPKGEWGSGRVELVLIPTDREINDNIVAFWVPQSLPEPGAPLRFDYRMRWLTSAKDLLPPGRVVATRLSHGRADAERTFVVDFEGPALQGLKPDAKVEAVVTVGQSATIMEQQTYHNPATNGWRLAFRILMDEATLGRFLPDKRPPVELRAFLRHGGDVLSETWSYAYRP